MLTGGIQMLKQAKPDGLHAGGDGDTFLAHQLGEARPIGLPSRKDEFGSHRWRRDWKAPAISVEHRHRHQKHVAAR